MSNTWDDEVLRAAKELRDAEVRADLAEREMAAAKGALDRAWKQLTDLIALASSRMNWEKALEG